MHVDSKGSCITREVAHLEASAFAERGRCLPIWCKHDTNSPLQSLATAEIIDFDSPTVAATLITFTNPLL